MTASLRCDDDVDSKMFAGGGELAFQTPRITDAAFGIINETQELRASSARAIAIGVSPHLVGKILSGESRAGFLQNDGQAIMIKQEGGARCAIAIGRRPLVRTDIVKVLTEQRMHEILDVEFIFNVDGGSILTA